MDKNKPDEYSSKEAGVAILISDKEDFRAKDIIKNKEGHSIMRKGSIHQENLILNA